MSVQASTLGTLSEASPRVAPRTVDAPASRGSAPEALRSALSRASGGVFAFSVPAPLTRPIALLRALRKTDSFLLESPSGEASLGLGAAWSFVSSGAERFARAQQASAALFARVQHQLHEGTRAPAPRLFAGFAFAPGSAALEPWSEFGDARLTLPRWHYHRDASRATLTFCADLDAQRPNEALVLAELSALLEAAQAPSPELALAPQVKAEHLSRSAWARTIDAARAAILRGEAQKIVASRRSVFTAATDLDALDVLCRLRADDATRFGVRVGGATFVGATPEHLFRVRGLRLHTEALAGSIAAHTPDAEAQLLASGKDREEHAYVVQHLLERLGPLCARVTHPDAPRLRRLPTVAHLQTPIEAQLREGVHPLALVAALHPTPAVGGTPPAAAVPWILDNEPAPRGWYAGPLGWFDAAGDAEMVVALRCGLVRGSRAWAWAGGGIVAGSEAGAEYEEAQLKLRPFLSALGIEG